MELRGFANYSAEALAKLTGARMRTVQRWRQRNQAPAWVLRVLEIVVRAQLGQLHPDWDGWTLHAGKLVSPEGCAFTPGEVRAIPIRFQQIAALECERRTWLAKNTVAPVPAPITPEARNALRYLRRRRRSVPSW
jgi:hypothetical protein